MNSKLHMHFPIIQFLEHHSCDHHHMLWQVQIEAVPILLALFHLQSLLVDAFKAASEKQDHTFSWGNVHTFSQKSFLKVDSLPLDSVCFSLFLHCTSGVCPIMAYLLNGQHPTWQKALTMMKLYSSLITERATLDQWRN